MLMLLNFGNNANAGIRGIDVGVADHEFFENVVLNGAGKLFRLHALFFRRDDIQRHDRKHGAIHRHRYAHLVQRNACEQRAHIVDAVDCHAGHADVAGNARVIGIVAAVRGQIEGDA
jgi:hypothetical protein